MDKLGLVIFEQVEEIRSAYWIFGNDEGMRTEEEAQVLNFDKGVVILQTPSLPNDAEYMQAVIDFGKTIYKSPLINV